MKKKKKKVCAGIVFTDGKRVLLLRRASKDDNFGKWSIPGGRAEKGEDPIETAKREAKEECGFLSGTFFGHFVDHDGPNVYHTFYCEVPRPAVITLSDEHDEYQWVEIPDVKKKNLHHRFKANWPRFKREIKKRFTMQTSFTEWLGRFRSS